MGANSGYTALAVVIGLALAMSTATTASADGYRLHPDAFTSNSGGIAAAGATRSQALWTSNTLDRIANDVTGATDMHVSVEDDPTEWATFFPPDVPAPDVLGFVLLNYAPLYHEIILSPFIYPVFGTWFASGTPAGNEYNFAIAAMTLVHESFHWRLNSGDESAVNACALKYLPSYLSNANDFNVPATITQTTTQRVPVVTTTNIPVKHIKITKRRVKVNGKWVIRTKRTTTTTLKTVTKTTYTSQPVTTAVPNPLYQTIVADAADFYAHQPPPYNAGTCPI